MKNKCRRWRTQKGFIKYARTEEGAVSAGFRYGSLSKRCSDLALQGLHLNCCVTTVPEDREAADDIDLEIGRSSPTASDEMMEETNGTPLMDVDKIEIKMVVEKEVSMDDDAPKLD